MIAHFGLWRICKIPESASAKRPLTRAVLVGKYREREVGKIAEGLVVETHQPLAQGIQRRLGAVGELELGQDAVGVRINRAFADHQCV